MIVGSLITLLDRDVDDALEPEVPIPPEEEEEKEEVEVPSSSSLLLLLNIRGGGSGVALEMINASQNSLQHDSSKIDMTSAIAALSSAFAQ